MNGSVSGMMETPAKTNEQSTGNSMPYGLQLMMMMTQASEPVPIGSQCSMCTSRLNRPFVWNAVIPRLVNFGLQTHEIHTPQNFLKMIRVKNRE